MFGRKSKPIKQKVTRADQLHADFTAVTALFQRHPFISIKETFGVPAEKYRILYKIEGLQRAGQTIEAKNEHIVEILLPPGYPDSPPICKSVSPVFHPNISADMIDIKEHWSKGSPLADLIVRIGEMIAFQKYSTSHPVNAEAGKWADRNSGILPLSGVDLRIHANAPEPATINAPVVETDAGEKKHEKPFSEGVSVNEIVIQVQDQDETPGPEDGRKTEGIVISSDTAQLVVEQVPDGVLPPEPKTAIISVSIPEPKAEALKSFPEPAKTPVQTPESLQKESEPPPVKEPSENKASEPVKADTAPSSPEQATAAVQAPEPLLQESGPSSAKEPSVQKPAAPPTVLFQFFYCPFCGNKNNKDANFCMNCGARITPIKKRNASKVASVIAMTVIPVAILTAGVTAVVMHLFNHAEKQTISFPSVQPQPEQEKPAPPQKATEMEQQEKNRVEEPITADAIAQKMTSMRETAVQKNRNVFAPGRLTEQQKNEKISDLLQNARLYMKIGSYDDAIKRYKEVLRLSPTNFDASMGLDSAQEARDKMPPRVPGPAQPEE